MRPRGHDTRKQRTDKEIWIISQAEEGFRIYSPKYPSFVYTVGGIPEEPSCTCLDFKHKPEDSDWQCKHILAVLDRMVPDDEDGETEKVRPDEARPTHTAPHPAPRRRSPKDTSNGTSQMLLKRSVSPDGRIDSLSIEFSCPVDSLPAGEIKDHAQKILALQDGIVDGFLKRNGNDKNDETDGQETTARGSANGTPVPARMLDIGGMDGKYGRRLYINVQVNGDIMRLFGSRKQLAEQLAGIGYPGLAERVEEGEHLNVACRVTTKPSPDGRFTNIDRVLSPEQNRSQTRGRR